MPATGTRFWIVPVVLSLGLLNTPLRGGPQPVQPPEPSKPRNAVEVEVRYIDDSAMKLKILDEKLEFVTKHGIMQVAVTDIRRIDFAPRVPADVAEKIAIAISKLAHPDFKIREAHTAELKAFRERAYSAALKAIKHDDPEIARRADEIVKHIQRTVPPALLESRDHDILHTDDSRIAGRFTAEVLRISTFQFGDQQLKLSDLRMLRTGAGPLGDDLAALPVAPANLSAHQNQFGKELAFTVTGYNPTPGANVSLWGTDVYTLDSNFAAAAVHAGLAKPGETVAVRVRIVPSPPQFVSALRNGINSTAYGNYPAGAFEFLRK